jgi:hypothetical protein
VWRGQACPLKILIWSPIGAVLCDAQAPPFRLCEGGVAAEDLRWLRRTPAPELGQFTTVLADAGTTVLKIPPRCPRRRYAGRFVLTIRTELTDRTLIFECQPAA